MSSDTVTSISTRTLTITLPESEWKALRTAEPDAIGWVRERIRERLASFQDSVPQTPPTASETWLGEDEY